jgi:hypothetical protein
MHQVGAPLRSASTARGHASVLAIDCKLLTVVEPELAVLFPSFGAGVVMQSFSPSRFAVDEILSTASSYLRPAH